MRDEDEAERRPKPKPRHEVGQDLATLSLHELDERIALLAVEIERLKAEAARKSASRSAADSVFRL